MSHKKNIKDFSVTITPIGISLNKHHLKNINLEGADLSGVILDNTDLSGVILKEANLEGANFYKTTLKYANLEGANLNKTTLRNTNLEGANLKNTCLDPELHKQQRELAKSQHQKGLILYRSSKSKVVGNTIYRPGHTYTAPYLSFSVETECHPGIYAGTFEWMRKHYPFESLVKVYVRAGDYIISSKGCVRCKRIRVLEEVKL